METKIIDTTTWNEDQQDEFIRGWTESGGPTEDYQVTCSWFSPWYAFDGKIEVPATINSIYDMGCYHWLVSKDELEKLLEEEYRLQAEEAEEERQWREEAMKDHDDMLA